MEKQNDRVILPITAEAVAEETKTATVSATTNGASNGHSEATASAPGQMAMLHADSAEKAYASTSLFDICPECGSATLAYEEGCRKCYSCGHSEC